MMDCFDSRLLLNESQKRSPTRRVFRSPRYSVTQQGCHASFRDNRPQNAIPTTSLAAKPIASAGLTEGNSVSANVLSQFNTRLQFNNQDRNIAPAVQPNRSLANRRGCPHLVSHFHRVRRGARLKMLPVMRRRNSQKTPQMAAGYLRHAVCFAYPLTPPISTPCA